MLINHFLIHTPETMTDEGGQTDIYVADGGLKMARDLERVWPGVVKTSRRWGIPQHVVASAWRKFDNKLIKKKGVSVAPGVDDYGMVLKTKRPIESKQLRELVKGSRDAR